MNSKRMANTSYRQNTTKKSMNIRKSPIVKLKEDLENLRHKNAEDELIIKTQNDEIEKLKELIAAKSSSSSETLIKEITVTNNDKELELQAEIESQLDIKQSLQEKLKIVAMETEKLSTILSESNYQANSFKNQIEELQTKLKENDGNFKIKEEEYQTLLRQKEQAIENLLLKRKELTRIHQLKIKQINNDILEKAQTQEKPPRKQNRKPELKLDQLIEEALKEFEQERHNHAPQPAHQLFANFVPFKPGTLRHINQQWYSQKYMPVDAMSWPAPESLPNLKKTSTVSAFTL